MKKNLLAFSIILIGFGAAAQTPRLSLFEEFTGENCPPCASTNPNLNITLSAPTNTPKVVAIKWQVPIPSAPSATWSLYKTNQAEIDWRYRSTAAGGYGYPNQWTPTVTPGSGINSAPTGLFDGQHQWVFGAASDHPVYVNSGIITTAQSYTSAFSITMQREWNATGSAVTLTISIQATAPFTAVGPLVFRTVMVEERIQFATPSGSNGETIFENAVIKSFPSIQTGVAMASSWTVGQTQTFTLNCPIPAYTRSKEQIAFVGFIQDDGNRKVAQAVRANKVQLTNDAVAVQAKVPVTCNSSINPEVTVYNNGAAAITAMTITPASDAIVGTVTNWTGNLAPGASTTIPLNSIPAGVTIGSHLFTYTITSLNSTDFNLTNNSAKVSYVVASGSQGTPVAESFSALAFPPPGFTNVNPNNGPGWSRSTAAGAYNIGNLHSSKYDFYNNTVIGDKDELVLPPIDLSGLVDPEMYFDMAYAMRNANSDDALDVFASNDCGLTWTNMYSSHGNLMPVTLNYYSAAYVPDPLDPGGHWKTETFPLPGFNTPNVLVKFVVTNDHGNNLYLDNINLVQYAPGAVGIAKTNTSQLNVALYPNPTNGIANASIYSPKAGEGKLTVMNVVGQVVFTKQLNLHEGQNNIQLDMKEYAGGIYNVAISTENGSIVKKLNVTK